MFQSYQFTTVFSFYAGLGKGAVFGVGNVYGGLAFKDRKKNKLLEQTVPFPDSVTRSQFYYMDQFILSASANKIHVHQVQSPNKHLQFYNFQIFTKKIYKSNLTIYIIRDVKKTPNTLSGFYTEVVRHRQKHIL